MGELTPLEQLSGPVVGEIAEKRVAVQGAEEATQVIHRVLYLTFGSQAGHVRNYTDPGWDLFELV